MCWSELLSTFGGIFLLNLLQDPCSFINIHVFSSSSTSSYNAFVEMAMSFHVHHSCSKKPFYIWWHHLFASLHVVRSCTNAFIFLLYTSTNVSCASFFGLTFFFQPLILDCVIQHFSFFTMQSQQIVTLSLKPNYIFLVNWLHWPQIIFKRLSQVVQEVWNKNLHHCPVNLIVLKSISCCLIFDLYFQV
jgi:hypothetical protein